MSTTSGIMNDIDGHSILVLEFHLVAFDFSLLHPEMRKRG